MVCLISFRKPILKDVSFTVPPGQTYALVCLNSLPNDKILDWSKLKAFADKNVIVTQNWTFALGREENIVGKGENAGYQHFLLFPQCFQKAFFPRAVKSLDCVVKSQLFTTQFRFLTTPKKKDLKEKRKIHSGERRKCW